MNTKASCRSRSRGRVDFGLPWRAPSLAKPATRFVFGMAFVLSTLFASLVGSTAAAHEGDHHGWLSGMVRRANQFLETLDAPLREKATFAMDSEERQNWHFIPKDRQGVALKEMNFKQRQAAHALLRSALSTKGYIKATTIMSLEQILRELERNEADGGARRDQEKYWLSIFGKPSLGEPWGWRIEGHHLSLNFTAAGGKLIASTPLFLGANPAEVKSGPRAGLRALAAEEDLARRLLGMLSAEQQEQAVLAAEAPADVFLKPDGEPIDLEKPAGLPASWMTPPQRRLLARLIEEYATNLRRELAQEELQAIRDEGISRIYFAWAGPRGRGKGHYYRIHGPSFIIEYDNTQNDANHIHTVWHSLSNDFGLDTLKKHYEQHPHE